MTDDQIEKLIWGEIQKRDVTFSDMIGLPNQGVDPNPEEKTSLDKKRIRSNRFQETFGCDRMMELLCVGKYNPYDDRPPLKIPLQDLFSFWWNRCVEKDLVIEEVLDDLYQYFTEKMRPPEKEREQMDITIDFDRLSLLTTEIERAA